MNRLIRRLAISLLALLSSQVLAAPAWVPPGFESLTQPQLNDVDVIYGGERITGAFARFTATTLEFRNPANVAAAVPDIIEPDVLEAVLAGPLATNAGASCPAGDPLACDIKTIDGIAVIFDRSRLRAELLIAPERRRRLAPASGGFLPRSDGGLSLVSRLTGNLSGMTTAGSAWTLGSRSLVAWRENHLELHTRVDDGGNTNIDTFALRRSFTGREWTAGRFRPATGPFGFFSHRMLTGVGIGTSLDTQLDARYTLGTPIEVFLPTRSRVEIWRNGDLLDAAYYDVGNQRIDTTRLPSGAYDVELRIVDAAGNETALDRFFSRSTQMPPGDRPLWFLQAGKLDEPLPGQSSRQVVARAGISWRAADTLATGVGLSVIEDSPMLELSAFHQGPRHELQASIAAESSGALGLDVRARYRFDSVNLNFNLRNIRGAGTDVAGQLERNSLQFGSSLNVATGYGNLNLFHRFSRAAMGGSRSDYGLLWRLASGRSDKGRLHTTFELSSNDGEATALLSLSWQLGRPDRNRTATLRVSGDDIAAELSGLRAIDDPRGGRHGLEWRLASDPITTVEGRLDSRTRHGNAQWDLRYQPGIGTLGYTGRFTTHLAMTDRRIAIGGSDNRAAGFLVRLDGPGTPGDALPVLVNGVRQTLIRAGEQIYVEAAPFRRHTIEIGTAENTLLRVEGGRHRMTLYPGNVVALDWALRDKVVLIGRVVDEAGAPLGDAVIENGEFPATTDTSGRFQIEVDRNADYLLMTRGATACEAPVDIPTAGPVGFAGIVTCSGNVVTAAADVAPAEAVGLP